MKPIRFIKYSVLILVVSLFLSCNSDDDFTDELSKNRQLWHSLQIENYSWNERLSCFCAGVLEREIFVVNEAKDTVTFKVPDLPPEVTFEEIYEQVFNDARTVDDAFNYIEEVISKNVDSFVVEYDETYGYPTLISVDYDFNIADDEIAYNYSNFEERL